MKNRKFLVSLATLVTAVASQQALATTGADENVIQQAPQAQAVTIQGSQNPFDFVLKRGNETQSMSYHTSHSSHSSHSSHRSHYSSR